MSAIACPVCEADCADPPLHRYTVEQAAAHFCPPVRNADLNQRFVKCIRRLWGGDSSAVYRCPKCRFGFGWPFVGGDEEFYSLMHEMAAYPGWRWDYDVTIERVISQYPTGGKVLDIGTGSGNFLKGLAANWEKFATEGSETTRARLRADGITCFADNADAIAQARGTFEVVTMFQVLEHIAAFDAMLRDCHELLKPGGSLVIAVPFAEATFAQEELTGCADMTPNHINKWTPEALSIAMKNAGFAPRQPWFEPGSWKLAGYRAWLRVRADASTRPNSLAAKAYKVRSRPMRIPVIGALTMVNVVRYLPRLGQMRQGHSFAMAGTRS